MGGRQPVRVPLGPRGALSAEQPLSAVAADGRPVCAFEVDGEPLAYAGACLHRGTSLAGGFVRDGIVTCPGHWWRYDLRTGEVTDRPGERLQAYPLEVVDGELVALLPPLDRPASIRERLLAAARAWQARAAQAETEAFGGREARDGAPKP